MTDFTDKTTDELRKMAARLRHPGGKERRRAIIGEIMRREMGDTPLGDTAEADVFGPPGVALSLDGDTAASILKATGLST